MFQKYFSLPSRAIYLNCAAQGPLSKAASLAMAQSIKDKEYPAPLDQNYGENLTQIAKTQIAKLVNCNPEYVSLANSTSWCINAIVNGFQFHDNDEILMLEGQFPSNSSPWSFLKNKNVKINKIKTDQYFFDLNSFEDSLNDNTKLICLEWVHFVSGDRIPLKEIINICNKKNIFIILDATQGLGAIPYDIKELPVDALICSAYKWLASPYGSGFMVLSDKLLKNLSVQQINWLNFKNIQYSGKLADCTYDFCDSARKFDVYSYMGFINLAGMAASIELFNHLNIPETYSYCRNLIEHLESNLNSDFFIPLNKNPQQDRNSLIATYKCKNVNTELLITELKKQDIIVSVRQGYLRIAPYIYNTTEQINYFCDLVNSFSKGTSITKPSTASV